MRRRSIFVAIAIAVGVAAATAWFYFRPRHYAVAYLEVKPATLWDEPPLSEAARRRFNISKVALCTSPFVAEEALQAAGVSHLELVVANSDNAAQWLAESLIVKNPNDGDILEVRLPVSGEDEIEDAKKIVDAICMAVIDKVRLELSVMEQSRRENLSSRIDLLRQTIIQKTTQLRAMKRTADKVEPEETAIQRDLLSAEIAGLREALVDCETQITMATIDKTVASRAGQAGFEAAHIIQKATAVTE